MGSTLSKVNHGLKASFLPSEKSRRGRTSPTVGCIDPPKHSSAKPTGRHKDKKSVSVKRRKPRYKKVTKSMVGRPSNFKHIGHMGAKDTTVSPVEAHMFSTQMTEISSQFNASLKAKQRHQARMKKSVPRTANQYYKGARKPVVNHNILLMDPPSLRTLMA